MNRILVHARPSPLATVGLLVVAATVLVSVAARSQGGGERLAPGGTGLELSRHTIDGGGVMFSAGGDLELSGTIGQPDAGVMTGGDLELTGGFWFALAPGDCNTDGGVNLFDYEDLEACLAGPTGGLSAPECACFDIDEDDDDDLRNIAGFQRAFSGG